MLKRRSILKGAASAIAGTSFPTILTSKALASGPKRMHDREPRGSVGRLERLPVLDLESRMDFNTGFRIFNVDRFRKAAEKRVTELLVANGYDPETPIEKSDLLELVEDDHIINSSAQHWLSIQQVMWSDLQNYFHEHADAYLAEMEETDGMGPGSLELNPQMELPKYTTVEIHMQPGGYVGDPFAGHMYHYGTNSFWYGQNHQDEMHEQLARIIPVPEDGAPVRRVLDMGCSVGQMTVRLKERFPDAEVWGIDVGGPMVRYAHMRAVDIGKEVHFAQQLAEATSFPDNYFDVVSSFLLFHEVSSEGAEGIIKEAARILRPGGKLYCSDIRDWERRGPESAFRTFQGHWITRWNHEVWAADHASNDYPKLLRDAGFDIEVRRNASIFATKMA